MVGMKSWAQRHAQPSGRAIKYALSLGLLDALTIGAENKTEQEDLIHRNFGSCLDRTDMPKSRRKGDRGA